MKYFIAYRARVGWFFPEEFCGWCVRWITGVASMEEQLKAEQAAIRHRLTSIHNNKRVEVVLTSVNRIQGN